jgi:CheY-like chemotaxis protein
MDPRPDPGTILLVDDDDTVRLLIGEVLRHVGFSVIESASAGEAVRLFNEHQSAIRLLVTDVIMPGASGTELADQVLRLKPELPVLFVSGYCEDYRAAMRGFACIAKPFAPAELLARVRELLETSTLIPVHAVVCGNANKI